MIFSKQSEFLQTIKKWGFSTNPLSEKINSLTEIEKQHIKIDNLRSSLNYDIDGLVYKVNDLKLQKDLEIPLSPQDGLLHINFQQKKLLQK